MQFSRFKADVYQRVLAIIFAKTRDASWRGLSLQCGDTRNRVLFPGLFIESLDGQEAWHYCCCREGHARHPCPRCLVASTQLHELTRSFPARNTASMRSVYEQVQRATTKAAKDNLLVAHGLHNTYVRSTVYHMHK